MRREALDKALKMTIVNNRLYPNRFHVTKPTRTEPKNWIWEEANGSTCKIEMIHKLKAETHWVLKESSQGDMLLAEFSHAKPKQKHYPEGYLKFCEQSFKGCQVTR